MKNIDLDAEFLAAIASKDLTKVKQTKVYKEMLAHALTMGAETIQKLEQVMVQAMNDPKLLHSCKVVTGITKEINIPFGGGKTSH